VEEPEEFLSSLETVSKQISLSAKEFFVLLDGSTNLFLLVLTDPALIGNILEETTGVNTYALVKLAGPAHGNFWRNKEVRKAAQDKLKNGGEGAWRKVKIVLGNKNVENEEDFLKMFAKLDDTDLPKLYTQRKQPTQRRKNLVKKFQCDKCDKSIPYNKHWHCIAGKNTHQ
jgi:hypothetical protein